MRTLPALALLLVALAACTTVSPEEVAASTLWFPPAVKRIDEPRFCFGAAERKHALQEFRRDGADTLFELVIDAEGKVKKARLLRTHVAPEYHADVLQHAYWLGFSPEPGGTGYRAFFFPMKYRYQTSAEWIDAG
jgi:hypothetical protein